MHINVLQITTVPAKIDVSTTNAVLSAHYVKPNLSIERTPAYIDTYSRNITCDIDSSACRADEGLKTASMLSAEHAQQGMDNAEEFAHSTANIGQELVHAGRGEDIYKEVARSELSGEVPDTGIRFIPSERPTITWNMNKLVMEGHPEKDTYNWTTSTFADVQIERKGGVTITETQKPEIHMSCSVEENSLNIFNSLDQRA